MFGNKDLYEDLVLKDLGEFKRVQGRLAIDGIGTLVIKMDNDNNRTHQIQIPNTIYAPALLMTLLCLQHWAQQFVTSDPSFPQSKVCYIMAEITVLEWDRYGFCKTIRHNQATNTPSFYTSPGTELYEFFYLQFEPLKAQVTPLETVLQRVDAPYYQC